MRPKELGLFLCTTFGWHDVDSGHTRAVDPANRRQMFDVLVCWRLDRFGRNLKQLIILLEELQTSRVAETAAGK
jgi:DNA invertase Pin-like site-specific DNA recombinase